MPPRRRGAFGGKDFAAWCQRMKLSNNGAARTLGISKSAVTTIKAGGNASITTARLCAALERLCHDKPVDEVVQSLDEALGVMRPKSRRAK